MTIAEFNETFFKHEKDNDWRGFLEDVTDEDIFTYVKFMENVSWMQEYDISKKLKQIFPEKFV
jgi:hypothetical protein